ncbi:hypothetical protein CDD81_1868 [Ophiocordyceps australis]|uniref:CRAL-TRIO domain-containing protein n=1 Tax=Ophiocordyceps australis TaxID=1399860 RepID=A0A2C5XY39_9HYPO|nr:hypothetical protein CDD81_1868 [Ophiocordyceps australis]
MAPQTRPIETPPPESKPPPPPVLTREQEDKYSALLERMRTLSTITCDKEPSKSGPINDVERAWLTRECLLRYLRATRWSVDEAAKRLHGTLGWRREYGLDGFTAEYISPEQETGKQFILGYDGGGRPCQYLNPGRQNTEQSARQVHHLFYMMERVVDVMPPGVESLSLLINFKPSRSKYSSTVPVATAREVLHILQNHYPERLGKALIINVPWIVWGFFKIINPFMDPVTRDKLKFNEDMTQYVAPGELWSSDWGGQLDFEYKHDEYWPALHALCRQRREARTARWEAGGKLVGESEVYLAGGSDQSVSGRRYGSDEGQSASNGHAAATCDAGVAAAHDAHEAAAVELKGNGLPADKAPQGVESNGQALEANGRA